ncbi:MAG: menaquinone-dependent protoporphyrinogen IX dehydrogenase [Zetaproteobacteria bacterium CG_4_9_14_3_um_filter_49_83]|nr:MAG: protoporphyrinogen oxidase [Zetaproteobacteria bacterium CG1_02_49_23]PIQ34157.1 MAG: menaquinone-dependent protoporphyrinogen IX dehydrogenase [Zetaproteobacteria bacterium CG17_big_fil_post_rev_8_21_14_2_50_50_13]PIV31219.1 MAG: menaquinone-dependent protoporphyrinogen IX dehydrogenase [Zetaproteobacteria bacterium CG02_land_8_20_14_3_00_50_9]PIY56932.1 MAG: menaquinone-dependent protoporphyrinogen IX dehydrogenase [Zetaproteobacteria bacterium CG_4_10_14_0_8_um_filter_49_80]PJA35329.
MSKTLFLYSSTDGHTRLICSRIQKIVENQHNQVTLLSIADAGSINLESFDTIVIGASIRYGKHQPQLYQFIEQHVHTLDSINNAFFSVNVVARKANRNRPETNPYMQKFLKKASWKPQALAVFAGKIEYQKYKFLDRMMIRFIMWMTDGPTAPDTNIEFTDWQQVERFGQMIANSNLSRNA